MKLTIDFDNKVITLIDQCNAYELVKRIKELFPNDWKEYKVETPTQYQNYPWWYVPCNIYTSPPVVNPFPIVTYTNHDDLFTIPPDAFKEIS